MTLLSDVEAALPEEFMTAASIWFNTPNATGDEVRGALDELVRLNKAERIWSPNLELFARTRRPGWDSWGNEVDKFEVTA